MGKKPTVGDEHTDVNSKTLPQADEDVPGMRNFEAAAASSLSPTLLQSSSAELLVDARAAAELLNVSESTFWKLHSQGRIPSPVRLGGRVVRWRREELGAWVRAGCPMRDRWKFPINE